MTEHDQRKRNVLFFLTVDNARSCSEKAAAYC